jgi:hypothetical protein
MSCEISRPLHLLGGNRPRKTSESHHIVSAELPFLVIGKRLNVQELQTVRRTVLISSLLLFRCHLLVISRRENGCTNQCMSKPLHCQTMKMGPPDRLPLLYPVMLLIQPLIPSEPWCHINYSAYRHHSACKIPRYLAQFQARKPSHVRLPSFSCTNESILCRRL